MSEKKQITAVEWLIEQLQRSKDFHRVINEVSQMSSAKIDLIQQAKEMHQKQSIEDMNKMQIIQDVDCDGNVKFIFNPEQYYKETYGE